MGLADLAADGVLDDGLVLVALSNPESLVLDLGDSAFAVCPLQIMVADGRDRDGLLPSLLVQVSSQRCASGGNFL